MRANDDRSNCRRASAPNTSARSRSAAATAARPRPSCSSAAQRRDQFEIRDLEPAARDRYAERWRAAQRRFVDQPGPAVGEADALVMEVMRDRGYPVADEFDQRAADISVDHPEVVEHYRAAHGISGRATAGEASTEDLRQAMVHFRELFVELLGEDDGPGRSAPSAPTADDPRASGRGPAHRQERERKGDELNGTIRRASEHPRHRVAERAPTTRASSATSPPSRRTRSTG